MAAGHRVESHEITFTGTSSLVNELDKLCMVVLRDGRHLVGVLRSYDQFANFVLEGTRERHFAAGKMADIPLGLYVIRGENVVMLAELDEALEADHPSLAPASIDEVLDAEATAAAAEAARKRESASQMWRMEMDM